MSNNPYAPPTAVVKDVPPHQASPALWNPSAAARWSLLFSPIFGATVQMKNWQALGEPEKAVNSKRWVFAGIGLIALFMVLGIVLPESNVLDVGFRAAGLCWLLAWYSQSSKAQVNYVNARFGTAYPRKGWMLPLLCALLCIFALVAAVFVVAYAVGLLQGEV